MIYLELKRVSEEQIPLMNWENVKLVGKLFSAFCTLLKITHVVTSQKVL